MNLINDICKLLDVEMYEEFMTDGTSNNVYRFQEDGLYQMLVMSNGDKEWLRNRIIMSDVIDGKYNIVKPRFIPTQGQRYYYWSFAEMAVRVETNDFTTMDITNILCGNCYRCERECKQNVKKDVIDKVKELYGNSIEESFENEEC